MLTADPVQAAKYQELRTVTKGGNGAALEALRGLAREVRLADLAMIGRAKLGHIGGDFSVTDVLVTLYGAVLNVDPTAPVKPERDRFILSKGH